MSPTGPTLVYEYSHLTTNGIDYHLFSELCSDRMTKSYSASPRYQDIHDGDWKASLPEHISSIIHRSNLGTSIAVAALILVERFQEALAVREPCSADEVEDAGRLFFIAYMIAAKVIDDDEYCLKFWQAVAMNQYSGRDISQLELQFCEVVGWKVQIDCESFDGCFVEMMNAYHCYLDRHELPTAPPPVYQQEHKNETAVAVLFQTEEGTQIPTLDEEDEALFLRALLSPRASRATRWSNYRWQFFGIVLRPPVHVPDQKKQVFTRR